jgi:hypothetical protein
MLGTNSAQILPGELVIEIAKYITCRKTLAALSQCSKRFHALVESLLYSTFIQTGDGAEALPQFLRTVSAKPHLGRYVKAIIAESHEGTMDMDMGLLNGTEMTNIGTCICRVIASSIPERTFVEWIRLVKLGAWDALMALVLCLVPNIEDIWIRGYGNARSHPLMDRVLNRAAKLQDALQSRSESSASPRPDLHLYPEGLSTSSRLFETEDSAMWRKDEQYVADHFALSHLTRVNLENHTDDFPNHGIEVLQILPYLALNSVTHLSTHMMCELHFDPSMHQPSPTPETIYTYPLPQFNFKSTAFSMRHSIVEPDALQSFLSFFSALKRFEYHFDYDLETCDAMMWHPSFVPRNVTDSLAHLSETLEELVITEAEDTYTTDDGPIGTLFAFKRLRKVEASANVLLGKCVLLYGQDPEGVLKAARYNVRQLRRFVRVYPPSIEHIIVRNCNVAIYDAMVELIKVGAPKSLLKIELAFNSNCPVQTFFKGAVLGQLARRNGIEVIQRQNGTTWCSSCSDNYSTTYRHIVPQISSIEL